MSKQVKLTIDGRETTVPEGTNLIEAAASAGVHVPNLCYVKGMKGVGACRLCLVELDGMKAPMIACNTRVKEGMKVKTNTEFLKQSRKFVIDLVLSMHPLDCMTCTKAGVCTLQKYAYDSEIKESTFIRKSFGYPVDAANPFIKRDSEYCILCGRCVRVCAEQGTNVLEFMGRGVGAKVTTAKDQPLQDSDCTFCGSCLDACPVNAILEADRWRKGREWDYEKVDSVCLFCGDACPIKVSTMEGSLMKINAGGDKGSVSHYICAYGRFGFDSIASDARISTPMIREKDKFREATWDEALKAAGAGLKKAGKDAAFLTTAGILNEDAIALTRLAAQLKSKNIASTASLYATDESLTGSAEASIDEADVIVLAGLNPSQWERVSPALDASIRRKVQRGGKLVTLKSDSIKIDEAATIAIKEEASKALKSIASALVEKGLKADKKVLDALKGAKADGKSAEAAELIKNAVNPLILCAPELYNAASALASIKGKAVSVAFEANAKGAVLMGIPADKETYDAIASGKKQKALYIIGDVPMSKANADFVVFQGAYMTELAKEADVILPAAASYESAGTIVDYMGNLKYHPAAVSPKGLAKASSDIFVGVAKQISKTAIKKATEADVKKALKSKPKKAAAATFERTKGIKAKSLAESILAPVVNASRLAWLRDAIKAGK